MLWCLLLLRAERGVSTDQSSGKLKDFAGGRWEPPLLSRIAVDQEYRVDLEMFEGPLDLLLYLTKKDEVDIYDISIERITKQYLSFIDTFQMLNIDLASEFIVMAANLMYLKSRTLLPKSQQPPEEEGDEEDPRWELIRQLVEYKKFKDAAGFLKVREAEGEKFFATKPEIDPEAAALAAEDPGLDVSIFDLIRAFQGVLDNFEAQREGSYEIFDEQFTVSDKIDHLLDIVEPSGQLTFFALFDSAASRSEVVVTFLALLELIKLKYFRVQQDGLLGEITLLRQEGDMEDALVR